MRKKKTGLSTPIFENLGLHCLEDHFGFVHAVANGFGYGEGGFRAEQVNLEQIDLKRHSRARRACIYSTKPILSVLCASAFQTRTAKAQIPPESTIKIRNQVETKRERELIAISDLKRRDTEDAEPC